MVARGKLRVLKAYSPAKVLENLESGRKKLEFGLGRIKCGNSDAIDTGGTHAVIIGGIPSLERFQVDPYGISRPKEDLADLYFIRWLIINEHTIPLHI